jgi:asparagine synthase (glutamine-hydrolysing)
MCGIVAIIASNHTRELERELDSSLNAIRHRGSEPPRTTWIESAHRRVAGLGCARLPFVGSASGAQPLCVDNLSIIFNGEIYNHNELRTTLQSMQVVFSTQSDTEVVLQGYKVWGTDILNRLEGMYAFVIFERITGHFFAARDRFGIKPLYYFQSHETWRLASELKAIAVPEDYARSKDIREVPPGGMILNNMVYGYDGQRVDSTADWAKPWLGTLEPGNRTAVPVPLMAGRLRELLNSSVRKMLDPTLQIGVLLSGGIDSSAILREAIEIVDRKQLVAFCVGAKRTRRPDGHDPTYARQCAKQCGVEYRFIEIQPDKMPENIEQAVYIMESFEPNHIRAGTAHIELAKGVKRHGISLVLCGEGADELLGGYQEYAEAETNQEKLGFLFHTFVSQLYRTQLQRVDRVMMHFGIEARVPFLDTELAKFIWRLPLSMKVRSLKCGTVTTKYLLRESYREDSLIGGEIPFRRKVPMGEGAGVGDNTQSSLFSIHANSVVGDEDLDHYKATYPQFHIQSKEEALYLRIFLSHFGPLEIATRRPTTNVLETT